MQLLGRGHVGTPKSARRERRAVHRDKVADSTYMEIRGRVSGKRLRIVGVVPLPRKDGRHPDAPVRSEAIREPE